ncbi:hypothetical protein SAMN05428971_0394 [Candidatus Pantoea varia]|uniref:Uncharacterized protein n=1 Tax=Candidatus Pantoea varia TaxID=1881036 RepID=A0A1I4WXM0_9GAMM|nr:hypothetical protein [Pantoea varia]SFN18185.1 hypothetical protein SAMN05428971_0394 [Pantoea varia]
MSAIETLSEMSEVWRLFNDMPDDATIGIDLAALYLGVNVRNIARYRQKGDDPHYFSTTLLEAKPATNESIIFLVTFVPGKMVIG